MQTKCVKNIDQIELNSIRQETFSKVQSHNDTYAARGQLGSKQNGCLIHLSVR